MTLITAPNGALRWLSKHTKLVAGILTAIVASAGAAGAIYSAAGTYAVDHLPISSQTAKAIVKQHVDTAVGEVIARQEGVASDVQTLRRDGNETRLQVNRLRRDALRANIWAREEQLRTATLVHVRRGIAAQLDQLRDDLDDANRERDRLNATR